MDLKQQLQNDLKEALRAHDKRRKSVIRMASAAITNAEVAQGGELDEAGMVAVLQKEARRRQDTIAELKRADRPDRPAAEEAELKILEEYLPRPLSRAEIAAGDQKVIAEVGAEGMQAMGTVMRRLMSELKGRADGRLVNEVVRDLPSG